MFCVIHYTDPQTKWRSKNQWNKNRKMKILWRRWVQFRSQSEEMVKTLPQCRKASFEDEFRQIGFVIVWPLSKTRHICPQLSPHPFNILGMCPWIRVYKVAWMIHGLVWKPWNRTKQKLDKEKFKKLQKNSLQTEL